MEQMTLVQTRRSAMRVLVVLALVLGAACAGAVRAQAAGSRTIRTRAMHHLAGDTDLGPNTIVFTPSMSQATIQSTLDSVSTQQVPNQFGSQRYAILFEPGTYGSVADPLDFQVGYYTEVAGLGAQPSDVVINGAINVFNQCTPSTTPGAAATCSGLDNFWRSLSNLTVNVTLPSTAPNYAPYSGDVYGVGCDNSAEMWAVSQAAPMRRVIVNGPAGAPLTLTLQDYCNPSDNFVSGGYFADDEFNGPAGQQVLNGGQQQFFTRNSNIDDWSNGVWNQVFLGDNGAPATNFGPGSSQYTNLPSARVSEEEPFIYTDASGADRVFVPAVQHNSVGPDYASGTTPGYSVSIRRFFIANPSTPVRSINAALAGGQNLILTPGVYYLPRAIEVTRPNTIVLGLGFATLIPQDGNVTMQTADVPGIKISSLIFDAGPVNSPALLDVGGASGHWGGWPARSRDGHRSGAQFGNHGDAGDPTLIQDVFFRIGGAEAGQATTSLVVDTDDTILDDIWAWRADHGAGAGWTSNRADTGVIVNGNDVTAYGLAVEHYQKFEVIWNGENGEDVFFQNEMPYDPPSQAAWMSSPTTDGYAAFLVAPWVRSFQGYGMGSYSFFDQGVPIFATQAFQSPDTVGVQWHDLLTVFLNATTGSGGIDSVINGVGGSSTAANPSTPVDVASYP